MNKFVKAVMILVSLGLIVGLVMIMGLLVDLPFITNFATNAYTSYSWVGTLLAVVVLVFIVLALVSILCDFFIPNPKDKYVTDRDIGQIEISDKSIESVANLAMGEVPGVRRHAAKVKGRPHPGHVKLHLYADTDNSTGLATTGKDIQDHVAQRLAESLDVKPTDIHVKMEPFAAAQNTRGVKAPRVV